jgi:CHAT domain-containing protein/tetratricopeptide (TPR) repeat protein
VVWALLSVLPLAVLVGAGEMVPEKDALGRAELEVAEASLRGGEFTAAAAAARAALELARARSDQHLEAAAENVLASVLHRQGKSRIAFDLQSRALANAQALGEQPLVARILVATGLGHWQRAEYLPAIQRCREAAAIAALADAEDHAAALRCLGLAHLKQGEYPPARAFFEQVAALAHTAADRHGEAEAWVDLGLLDLDLRSFAAALANLERAQELLAPAADAASRARVLAQIGLVYLFEGRSDAARERFQAALQLATTTGSSAQRAHALMLLAGWHRDHGTTARALDYYATAFALYAVAGDGREQAWVLARTARARAREGDWAAALFDFRRAQSIWDEMGDQRAAAWNLAAIGRLHEHLGDTEQALEFLERARSAAREIRLPYTSTLVGGLARVHARRGHAEPALRLASEAVAEAARVDNPEMRWTAAYDQGHVHLALGERERAAAWFLEALRILESMRAGSTANEESSSAYLESREDIFADAIGVLHDLGRGGEALAVAERARARTLAEMVARAQLGTRAGAAVAPPSWPVLRARLVTERATALEFFCGRERTFAWVVKPGGEVHSVALPYGRRQVETLVAELRSALGADRAARSWEIEERAAELPAVAESIAPLPLPPEQPERLQRRAYEMLVQPVAQWLPTRAEDRLILVPHRQLLLLPFAALLGPTGEYFLERHTLLYAPALHLLAARSDRTAALPLRNPRVLLVGNPDMPRLPGRQRPLPPLPAAEQEVLTIAPLFAKGRVTTLLGASAREAAVRELAPRQNILHFSTHGVVRDDDPLASLLALAPGNPEPTGRAGDDGMWTVREIAALRLEADLVTLSACDTGLGKVSGDGIIGLSQAFMGAGAATLLVSLWRVSDAVARFQMEVFYRELTSNGGDPPAALRQAQLAALAALRRGALHSPSGRAIPEEPMYWAPFVLIGREGTAASEWASSATSSTLVEPVRMKRPALRR